MNHNISSDISQEWWHLASSFLAGRADSRRNQGKRGSERDRFLCGPDLRHGESQNGGNYGRYEEADSWSTGGEHAPVGSGDVLAETEWERLRKRLFCLTSEHVCGFDSRSPLSLCPPSPWPAKRDLRRRDSLILRSRFNSRLPHEPWNTPTKRGATASSQGAVTFHSC